MCGRGVLAGWLAGWLAIKGIRVISDLTTCISSLSFGFKVSVTLIVLLVLPSQVSYGLIGWVGVGFKYSKSFVCIRKHTVTQPHTLQGCPAEGRLPHGECYPALSFELQPVSYSLQFRQCSPAPTPTFISFLRLMLGA